MAEQGPDHLDAVRVLAQVDEADQMAELVRGQPHAELARQEAADLAAQRDQRLGPALRAREQAAGAGAGQHRPHPGAVALEQGTGPSRQRFQLEGIVHKTTRIGRPQSNGIVERLHRTLLDEHLRIQGRAVWYKTVAEMQAALDGYLLRYNRERPHQRRGMNGRTPLRAFMDGLPARPDERGS